MRQYAPIKQISGNSIVNNCAGQMIVAINVDEFCTISLYRGKCDNVAIFIFVSTSRYRFGWFFPFLWLVNDQVPPILIRIQFRIFFTIVSVSATLFLYFPTKLGSGFYVGNTLAKNINDN